MVPSTYHTWYYTTQHRRKCQLLRDYLGTRAALTTHELEWLEPWGKLAELELKCSNLELVDVGDTNVTQGT